jgi:hypothetical protein
LLLIVGMVAVAIVATIIMMLFTTLRDGAPIALSVLRSTMSIPSFARSAFETWQQQE